MTSVTEKYHKLFLSRPARLVAAAGAVLLIGAGVASVRFGSRPAEASTASGVTINRAAPPAKPELGDKCVSCHRAYVQSFAAEVHGKTAKFLHDSRSANCDSCHGDGTKHIENREKRIAAADITNPTELETPEERRRANATCLDCHSRDRGHFDWAGSEHDSSAMSCMSCHTVHYKKLPSSAVAARSRAMFDGPPLDAADTKYPEHMLAAFTIEETCFGCHMEQRKAFMQRSTHLFRTELRNMKVGCTSCHNPHGGEAGKMLKDHTVNDVCYTCHAEKRGPFLWDHPPVRENCLNCHSPHGSNNPKLLTARAHMVCQECHIHMLPRHSTTAGRPLDIWSLNRGCLNCHGQIHGSNHPGGRTLTR